MVLYPVVGGISAREQEKTMKSPYRKKLPNKPWDIKYPSKRRCPHPDCPIPFEDPWPKQECTLHKPIWISIPPGEHIHLDCPVHPEGHIIYGPRVYWMNDPIRPQFDFRDDDDWRDPYPQPNLPKWKITCQA
jgi:hypothetical protein